MYESFTSFPRPLVFESLFAGSAGVPLAAKRRLRERVPRSTPEGETLRYSEERSRDLRDCQLPIADCQFEIERTEIQFTIGNRKLAIGNDLSPDSRMSVQILDFYGVNNNFYRDFNGNCEETDELFLMALYLRGDQRIYMSSAWQEGLVELAILSFIQNR